jgi:hypothetical protein
MEQLNLTQYLFQLLLLVVSIATPIITTSIVRYFQTKFSNETLKRYISYAETAVKAAETTYNARGQGVFKKADVEKYLSAKIKGALTPEDIDLLIQAAVYEINKTGSKLIFETPQAPQPVNYQSY